MRVDPKVTRRKFDQQIDHLMVDVEALKQKGCHVSKIDYPFVEAMLQPRNPVSTFIRVLIVDKARPGVVVGDQRVLVQYPYLMARQLGVRLNFLDFDQMAPSLTFHDPQSWVELPYEQIPPGILKSDAGGVLPIVIPKHPETGRPFLCMRFIREFHIHPQHTNDPWVWCRSEFRLPYVLDRIADVFVTWPNPIVGHEVIPNQHLAM